MSLYKWWYYYHQHKIEIEGKIMDGLVLNDCCLFLLFLLFDVFVCLFVWWFVIDVVGWLLVLRGLCVNIISRGLYS